MANSKTQTQGKSLCFKHWTFKPIPFIIQRCFRAKVCFLAFLKPIYIGFQVFSDLLLNARIAFKLVPLFQVGKSCLWEQKVF